MKKIDKFDLHLTQLILNTPNLKSENREVVVGRLTENISFSKNNPFNLKVNNKEPFEFKVSFDSIHNFDLQYIHRLNNTPFYVSYLTSDNFNLKIVDFYDWHPHTSIYRLFIIKRIGLKSENDFPGIDLNIDSKLKQESDNQVKINEVTLKISNNIRINENHVTTELSTTSDSFYFAISINYGNDIISSITLDNIVKKFHDLYDTCRSNHISKYFITKNQKAELELDELWNYQKYILPDLKLEKQSLQDKEQAEISKYWINNFYEYFSLRSELKYKIKDEINKSLKLFDYLPSKVRLLKYLNEFDTNNKELSIKIQEWWDAYSLPVFENVFSSKCLKEPEEVFVIYFLAIGLKLPWAPILFNKLESTTNVESISPLHSFMFLLSFFFKRLFKNKDINGNIFYSAGYFWDNNYKSICNGEKKTKFEITKFTDEAYTNLNLGSDKSLKINKLCKIQVDEKNTSISILPLINNANNQFKIINHLIIGIEAYTIDLPLVWQNGYINFSNVKIKWILKKNRFQLTIHSSEKKNIQLNKDFIELNPYKKVIHYIEISQIEPQLYINLFNRVGGSIFTQISEQLVRIMVSGFAITRFGTLTNNVLYSSKLKKHQLFENKFTNKDISTIQVNKVINKLRLFIKYKSVSLDIPYIENIFMDRFLNLNNNDRVKLLLIIDKKFANNLQMILTFFKCNFGFQPDYMLVEQKSNIQLGSNLIIEFLFKNQVSEKEKIFFKDKNSITFYGNSFEIIVNYFMILINKYVKYS